MFIYVHLCTEIQKFNKSKENINPLISPLASLSKAFYIGDNCSKKNVTIYANIVYADSMNKPKTITQ